nr:MnhB domain-containing protein [Streptomyces coryli]
MLFGAVLGTIVLLRRAPDERRVRPPRVRVLPSTRAYGTVLLPVVLLTAAYLVAHGHLTPGGGFQAGVIAASGVHLAYLAADYRVLERIRPTAALDVTHAAGAAAYAALGFAGFAAAAGTYLRNAAPHGTLRELASGGLVPAFNTAVFAAVGAGVVVLLAHFLDQALEIESAEERSG